MPKSWWRNYYLRRAAGCRDVADSYDRVAAAVAATDPEWSIFARCRAAMNRLWAEEDEQRAEAYA